LLNDEAYVEAAKAFGLAIASEPVGTIDDRIIFAFERSLARMPSSEELTIVRELYERELNRLELAEASKIIGAYQPTFQSKPSLELNSWAAWFCVANVLLNLDETITKN
jgi:hypothetical protein